jgi:hypothetical protein
VRERSFAILPRAYREEGKERERNHELAPADDDNDER